MAPSLRLNDVDTGISEEPCDFFFRIRYQQWMNQFPEKTVHVNVNDSNTCLGLIGPHFLQTKLHQLDPEVFPLLNDRGIIEVENSPDRKKSTYVEAILQRAKRRATMADPEGELLI